MPMMSGSLESLVRRAAVARGFSPDVAWARAQQQGIRDESEISSIFPSVELPRQKEAPGDARVAPGQMHEMPNYGGTGTRSSGSGGGGLLSGIFGNDSAVGQAAGGVRGLLGGISNDEASGFLDYGGVPFGTRMLALSEAIGAARSGRSMNPDIMGMVPAAKEANRVRAMASSLADNLQATNPVLADAIRSNPALVRDYMKGQIDLEQARQEAEMQHGYRVQEAETERGWRTADEERKRGWTVEDRNYETEHTPEALWAKSWAEYVDSTDQANSSTTELYRRYFNDPTLTDTEAQRLANANRSQEALSTEYGKVLDDRNTKSRDTLAVQSGGLEKGEYITNPEEVARGGQPVVGVMKNSKREQDMLEAQAVNENIEAHKFATSQDVVRAANEALGSLARSEKGYSLPSTSWGAILKYVPGTEAKSLSNSIHTLNSNLALDKVIDIRQATKTGAGIGPPSDFEQKMLMSAKTTLDQYEQSDDLRRDIIYATKIYEATTTYTKGSDGKYRSIMENDAMELRADPSEENIAEFNSVYGQGAAGYALSKSDATAP